MSTTDKEVTIIQYAYDDFDTYCENFPKLTFEQRELLRAIFIEAWIRGFANRIIKGEANNVR